MASKKIRLTTNWYAQAEHGGFYQAVAAGIYADHGLDVSIDMGGPQVNNLQLLLAGKTDFVVGFGIRAINSLNEDLPVVTVAAYFQKDPQAILAHPDIESLADLKGKPIAVAASADTTYWPWLEEKYGFTGGQKQPYQFSVAPFIANPDLSQQGYVTSEPYAVQQAADFEPEIFLFADYGYPAYSTTITTTRDMVENHPDVVQRFVAASIEGWQSFLDDPAQAKKLIQEENADMGDGQFDFGVDKIREYELVTGGDAVEQGIGIMTDARWQQTFNFMREAGMVDADVDYKKAYTLKFVQQAHADANPDAPQ
ncbi:ABC transporter substrate-binding protein [Salinisphaera shabanensis]|uniref:ABC transporter substrate-binding protein n=1 Tax=Salinisphaera shabanensis TaxID=180542 RepID=UPI0002122EFF|nr:ABC transporter substrate-binding protein [Salinisphaera shabanensis]